MTLQSRPPETDPAIGTPAPPAPATPNSPADTTPDLRAELRKARIALAQSETRRHAQRLLLEARTIDLDAATLLIESALKPAPDIDAESAPDAKAITRAVEDLRRRKPVLFRAPGGGGGGGAMSPHITRSAAAPAELLQHAATTGDRNALIRYLRARRTTG
jgi:hypothetical protein